MAELLVMNVDRVNPDDIYKDAKLYKRGDVVVVCPDGWPWSETERTGPDFAIVKIPGMKVEEALDFLEPEKDADPSSPSKTLQRRAVKVDLDALKKDPKAADLLAVKVDKQPIADPAVIDNVGIIG